MSHCADTSCPTCRPVTHTRRVHSIPLPECPCVCDCKAPLPRGLAATQEVCTRCIPHQERTWRAARDRVVAQTKEEQRQARLHREALARRNRRRPHA